MSRTLTYAQALNEALVQEMERDPEVFILGEDVGVMGGDFGVTRGIYHRWPDRIHDTALSESAILGLCAGAATCGMRPVPEIMYADFLGGCFDQVVNNLAKMNYLFQGERPCAVTIRAPHGAGTRKGYHHSTCVDSWFRSTMGLVIVCPTTPYEAKGMLISAIRNNNPVLFLEPKHLYPTVGEVPEEPYTIPLYQAEVECEGKDLTIVASQLTLKMAHEAAQALEKEGVSVEIIDPRTLFPLDKDTIKNSVAKTGRLVIAQEGPVMGGWAADVSAMVAAEVFEHLKAPIKRVTSLDAPLSSTGYIEDFILPNSDRLLNACRKVLAY